MSTWPDVSLNPQTTDRGVPLVICRGSRAPLRPLALRPSSCALRPHHTSHITVHFALFTLFVETLFHVTYGILNILNITCPTTINQPNNVTLKYGFFFARIET
ncbi:uncharacterized protein LOC143913771 [Arctopsyche grandis]|uniref:uncharacterized protein LOC143913771 n=1 Tax=Arctopsyche grandis TaxID=121162 RepID=UPI00406D9C6B